MADERDYLWGTRGDQGQTKFLFCWTSHAAYLQYVLTHSQNSTGRHCYMLPLPNVSVSVYYLRRPHSLRAAKYVKVSLLEYDPT
jgi:hypothetical protein